MIDDLVALFLRLVLEFVAIYHAITKKQKIWSWVLLMNLGITFLFINYWGDYSIYILLIYYISWFFSWVFSDN